MSDPVEGFMRDIAFDDGMGFGLGIGGPADAGESARQRLAEYVKIVRKGATPGEADQRERAFLVALEQRIAAEVAKTGDVEAKADLNKALAVVATDRARLDARR